MPYLGAADPMPRHARRIIIAGPSGAGKTHLASRIASILKMPHFELDALHHGPGWVKRPSFEAEVARFAETDRWVAEWQYGTVRALLAARADVLIWIDLPRSRVMWQVTRRTVLRSLRREVLWNGNREQPLWRIFRDRDHIMRWAWRTHTDTGPRVLALMNERPDLPVVRLSRRVDVELWVATLAQNRNHTFS